ncbi:MAG: nucleoside-diphosphate kinase [Clostridia bacterium]
MERTYIMIKPDGMRKNLKDEIVSRISKKEFKISKMKQFSLNKNVLLEHYAHVANMPFYPDMEKFMLSGPVLGMIVEGENAILGMRELMGPTKNAPKGTIRGDYAESTTFNIIHGSDSPENAEIEIKRFFGNHFDNEINY